MPVIGPPNSSWPWCPTCWLLDGFHDKDAHVAYQVPRELLKESGWHKQKT
jgi:hypothetical protein